MSNREIINAYRQLYKHGLRAVQFSKPVRYTLRDRLRQSFRNGSPADFDPVKVENTVSFLKGAASAKGLEHKILKSLMHTWYYEQPHIASRWQWPGKDDPAFKMRSPNHFHHTVRMLNESMGMCLPTS